MSRAVVAGWQKKRESQGCDSAKGSIPVEARPVFVLFASVVEKRLRQSAATETCARTFPLQTRSCIFDCPLVADRSSSTTREVGTLIGDPSNNAEMQHAHGCILACEVAQPCDKSCVCKDKEVAEVRLEDVCTEVNPSRGQHSKYPSVPQRSRGLVVAGGAGGCWR